jgi:hypothetical protein
VANCVHFPAPCIAILIRQCVLHRLYCDKHSKAMIASRVVLCTEPPEILGRIHYVGGLSTSKLTETTHVLVTPDGVSFGECFSSVNRTPLIQSASFILDGHHSIMRSHDRVQLCLAAQRAAQRLNPLEDVVGGRKSLTTQVSSFFSNTQFVALCRNDSF